MDNPDTFNGVPVVWDNAKDKEINITKCAFCLNEKKCIILKDLDTGLLLNICVKCSADMSNTIREYLYKEARKI